MISKAFELKATSATWHGVPPKFKWKITLVLIVSYFTHRIGYFPAESCFSLLVNWGLASRFVEILSATKVNEKLHIVLFIFLRHYTCSDTEMWGQLDKLHVFGKFAFALHLSEILVVLLSVFGVRNFHHVLVKETHKLRFFHWLLDSFELFTGHVFEFKICRILLGRSGYHWIEKDKTEWNL